jgi:hypothetical protein
VIIEHEAERARAHPNSNRRKLSLPKANTAAWPEDVIDADAGWPPLVILPKQMDVSRRTSFSGRHSRLRNTTALIRAARDADAAALPRMQTELARQDAAVLDDSPDFRSSAVRTRLSRFFSPAPLIMTIDKQFVRPA